MKSLILLLPVLSLFFAPSLVGAADTTAKNLERAKAEFETEMVEIKKLAVAVLEQQEASARKSGNKPLLDWTKVETEQFEKLGALPQARSAQLQKKFDGAHNKLESAFKTAIKEYTKAKRDADAASTLKDFRAMRLNRMIAGFQFKGTWKTTHDQGGWSGTFVIDGPYASFGGGKLLTWSRDGDTVTLHFGEGVNETVTINVDSPNELRGASSRGPRLSWVRIK